MQNSLYLWPESKLNKEILINMTEEQLKQLIKQGESQTVEFKASTGLKKEICQAVSAFSNTAGGVILVGVSPKGEVLGVNIGKETVEDLANCIKRNTDPPIYPQIYIHKIEGKEIIEISVKEAEEKPVFYDGHAFQRAGRTSPRISASKIREMARQERKKLSWDERVCEDATLNDVDKQKIQWFLERRERIRNV